METETENLNKSLAAFKEAFIKAIRAFFERLIDWIMAFVKAAWKIIKESIEQQERDRHSNDSAYEWKSSLMTQNRKIIHQMKIQTERARSIQQPWKAWKAQRR